MVLGRVENCEKWRKCWLPVFLFFPLQTRAITKRDHTPQQLLVTKQINVTGMQNKRQKRA